MSNPDPYVLLVCGGRDFRDAPKVNMALNAFLRDHPKLCILQGGAPGADRLAMTWAHTRGVPHMDIPANWEYHIKRGGTLRNTWLLDYGRPHAVLAFRGNSGTLDMKTQAKERGIHVYEV